MNLVIKPKEGRRFDLVALGEVMLRFDPGEDRISTTRAFRVWEGGGEYNVARALKRCFGLDTAIVTALADNAIGSLIEDLLYQGGVDRSYLRWVPYDGVGRTVRNGLNFTERGFGLRGGVGCSDRGNTATSQLKPGDIDWGRLFGHDGTRWFHTGGIFAGLSSSTAEVAEEAMVAARRHGAVVSYDLNYRESIWKGVGGENRAQNVNRALAKHVDVIIGNEEDFTAALDSRSRMEVLRFPSLMSLATSGWRRHWSPPIRTSPSSQRRCAARRPRAETIGAPCVSRAGGRTRRRLVAIWKSSTASEGATPSPPG